VTIVERKQFLVLAKDMDVVLLEKDGVKELRKQKEHFLQIFKCTRE
jgi:hypothetical protein